MALLPIHKYFIFNDKIQRIHLFVPSENEGGIYEVLRVKDGIPLFLEDHLIRFYNSAKIAGKTLRFSENQIETFLNRLIRKNNIQEGNILISCKINLKAFFISHSYPTIEMYKNGVVCGILKAERENPNAKVFQTSVRQKANNLIVEKGFYEVLLVDHQNRITEGSRSNVFFIRGNEIFTAPQNKVLLGITRQKTIDRAEKLGFKVIEKEISYADISTFQAVFITGTSPKILPLKQIENVVFDVENKLVRELMNSFDECIDEYISVKIQQ